MILRRQTEIWHLMKQFRLFTPVIHRNVRRTEVLDFLLTEGPRL